jgi:hypothetical protein
VYANDRSPVHSARYAKFGNRGQSFSTDTTVNPRQNAPASTQPSLTQARGGPAKLSTEGGYSVMGFNVDTNNDDSGHPIEHRFVRYMPTSTCIVCHVHPGTNVLNSYLGFMWWDNESDARFMYPRTQKDPSPEEDYRANLHNPEGSAARGLWSNLYPDDADHTGKKAGPDFLQNLGTDEFNKKLDRVQFADFHGHGWVFRAVFKLDRHGHMLDNAGKVVPDPKAADLMAAVKHTYQSPKDATDFDAVAKAKRDQEASMAGKPVHLKDIHLERGMQCVDCHFGQDNHGDGNLYGETRNPVMVECIDCHGDVGRAPKMFSWLNADSNKEKAKYVNELFTGNAKATYPRAQDVVTQHFKVTGGKLFQKSMTYEEGLARAKEAGKEAEFTRDAEARGVPSGWFVTMVTDNKAADNDPDAGHKNAAAWAHTVRKDNRTWGGRGEKETPEQFGASLAHGSTTMSCYACHSSWNTSCFGCHLPQRANQRKPMLHNEAAKTRNYTNYNYQTLRDDVYMLGVDSSVKGNRIVPIRSACAVMVSSQDALRQSLYTQQQTVSAEGYAGTSFSPNFPHTVRTRETKQCNDCHLSKDDKGNDNNAVMAQLLLQGTNSVNFIGKWAWVAEERGGLEAVQVTEQTEPQAVIGSTLHKWAYPRNFAEHDAHNKELTEHHHHDGTVYDLQVRGEYLYAACGKDGFIAYDIANIDNKGFSERIITAPVSPLGQRFYVRSKFATSICSPSTLAIDPTRPRLTYDDKENHKFTNPDGTVVDLSLNHEGTITEIGKPEKIIEQRAIPLFFAFLYLTDAEEGLIVIGNPLNDKKNKPGVATLLDGDPENNFLQRATLDVDGKKEKSFNPGGALTGAVHMAVYGTHAYVSTKSGVAIVDLTDPLKPRLVGKIDGLKNARRVAFQFRYAFVLDDDGMHVFDVTKIEAPKAVTVLPLKDARDVYVSRTYAYVAGGANGLYVVDVEHPEHPQLVETFTAGGELNDVRAVRTGITNSSMFAYVANGDRGLAVLQLTSPDDESRDYMGFAPRPQPRLVARHKTRGPAVAISEGLDRDRAVDEAGNQLSVFGRKGARPFTKKEMERLYLKDGEPFYVSTKGDPANATAPAAGAGGEAPKPETPKPRFPRPRPAS